MPKKCKRCGAVNDSDARHCKKCGGTEFTSGKTATSPGGRAGGGSGKPLYCKKCGQERRVKGKTTGYPVEPSPTSMYWTEYEYYVLECNHIILIRETGRTKIDSSVEL